ncbi:SDR family oxidoreductase [Rhodococcus sp. USK13]|uniref:SDR family oxidoreductase n=1 Tax=Rhodococcus sp. USK13 TaxID=2806442 RepID=UPI001BCC3385|nr:SDR family oxidoreductase [Rhodococcus sp. USK13]
MTRDERLTKNTILVLGGGSGIGLGAALAYHRAGAHVVVLERAPDIAEKLAGSSELEVYVGDATDPDTVSEVIDSIVDNRGRLDNLTCCVGVFDHYASLRNLNAQQFEQAAAEIWRVNVLSTLSAVRLAWPALNDARGSVTLTLSESAFRGSGGGVLYGTSKWALRGAVAHLAVDYAPNVRVNGVAPGGTAATGFSGLLALGQDELSVRDSVGREERIARSNLLGVVPTPEDLAAAYVYLADPQAGRVLTGVVINADGGCRV